jgi:hypothetical protein
MHRIVLVVSVLLSCSACAAERNDRIGRDVEDTVAWERGQSTCAREQSAPYGAACSCASDCMSDLECIPEIPTGFPRNACLKLCINDGKCPVAAQCIAGFCLPTCATSADCREGQRCSLSTCMPGCQKDEQCLTGHCNRDSGLCSQNEEAGRKGMLEPCRRSDECRSGFCSNAGRCLSTCSTDRAACPDDAVCVSVGRGVDGMCSFECQRSEDCDGLACESQRDGSQTCATP